MGVTWVMVLPPYEGKTLNNALDDFSRHLVNQGFEKDQPFTLKCETYSSSQGLPFQKSFQALTDSDRPASCFLVSDKDPAMLNITAEKSLMGFIGKLDKAYGAKKNSVIEVQGTSFLYHDFIVRAGILSFGGAAKGITVEAELRSCPVAINASEMMREFVNGFMPVPLDAAPAFLTQRPQLLSSMFSVMDTVLQYLDIFSHVRRNNQMPART